MPFQQTVQFQQASGVPGEKAYDGPSRVFPWTLVSTPNPNVIGATAYTEVSEGVATAGGTGPFVGILVDPKAYALLGTAVINGALFPSMVLPDEAVGELATMGIFYATLLTAAAIGDYVMYNETTGALSSTPPATAPGTGFALVPNAKVILRASAASGTAIIQLTN
jgi:hypothetical protein